MVYQYPTRRRARPKITRLPVGIPEYKEPEVLDLIQGKRPQSREEWRVSISLTKYRIQFRYQIPIRGGTRLRGGQILDFLVLNPFPEPLQVFGEYWHSGQLKDIDKYKLAIIRQVFGKEAKVLYDYDLRTQQQTDQAIVNLFLR